MKYYEGCEEITREKTRDFQAKMKLGYDFKKAYAARRAWEFYNHPEVYGDWDAAAYLRRVVELIHPNRQINIPNLEAMIRAAAKDGVDICTYCPDYNCRGCIVNEWKEDPDDE